MTKQLSAEARTDSILQDTAGSHLHVLRDRIIRIVQEAEKQAQVEVLAACISATCVLCRTEKPYQMWFGGKNWKGRYQAWVHDVKLEGRIEVQTCPANAIHTLQPAAAALEALLREERQYEAQWWAGLFLKEPWESGIGSAEAKNRAIERMDELEKARASEGKG